MTRREILVNYLRGGRGGLFVAGYGSLFRRFLLGFPLVSTVGVVVVAEIVLRRVVLRRSFLGDVRGRFHVPLRHVKVARVQQRRIALRVHRQVIQQ